MLPRYSMAFKAKMIQRMLGPDQRSASALSREMGVSQVTLSRWKRARRTPADRPRLLAASESLSGDERGLEVDSRGGKKTFDQKELQELRRELHRKEMALAEHQPPRLERHMHARQRSFAAPKIL